MSPSIYPHGLGLEVTLHIICLVLYLDDTEYEVTYLTPFPLMKWHNKLYFK